MSAGFAALLADAVLAAHAAIVAFVVVGALGILAGGPLGWRWVRHRGFRIVHLALMVGIAAQAWLGRLCPLTVWEQALRSHAGQVSYGESFVQHWLSRLIFFEAQWWVFVAAYSAFALLLAGCWWRWPPRRPGPGMDPAGRPQAKKP
ncbi:DUF2784 domain-containing protein [Luteimonas sp. RD2P54]|uniref:DUF2784 domain-containing protein n=1 Tax=Luteimonas endophytica TaxID=3042023 RepID=A0ABT6JB33_9GAMM|nr:DUF2784 domain-containing protein [Luteimonas endophytica]MDH5824041.1 DUF2784 domain-containing protein [Luteimonas endophytica]